MKDVVLILSDQHSGFNTSLFDNDSAITRNLEKMAETSTVFLNAYCNYPLCVPSRMSFLAGKEAGELKILDNDALLNSNEETIVDKYANAGYKTILVGRMHFKGSDQFHGFQQRYVGDITTQYWKEKRDDLGVFDGTFKMKGCLKEFGYGDSPVEEFDEEVCQKAVELLKEKHDQPIFMVIGFYSPHFPYCCEEELFNHYFDNVESPEDIEALKYYENWQQNLDDNDLRNVTASYYGMIESLDKKIGRIKESYDESDLDGLFIYTSDHGEQIGKRKLYGKRTLYEQSIRIPMIIENSEDKNSNQINNEVSLLDLSQYLCSYADLKKNEAGENIYHKKDPVRVTSLLDNDIIAQAIIQDSFKLVSYDNEDYYLYDLENDPDEKSNIIEQKSDILDQLVKHLHNDEKIKEYKQANQKQKEITRMNAEWTKQAKPEDTIRYKFKKKNLKVPERG